ncbi:MAG: SIS domain-containing protein [Acidobacteriia bacterium]|nr:SIS domain-containing protein [Terriglobia bacterium]
MSASTSDWLRSFSAQDGASELLLASQERQEAAGYRHTLAEILQQPATWLDTCERLISHAPAIRASLEDVSLIVLTGSGSSQYAGECARLALQSELRITVEAIDSGALLTHGGRVMAPGRPALAISLARSGDSPESVGAVSALLETEPQVRHLVLTCNAGGSLVKTYGADRRVHTVVLDPRTNDRSLVMTSSFTNLVLAARSLGFPGNPDAWRRLCCRLSGLCRLLIQENFGAIARVAKSGFGRAVFLGSGCRFGAAREAALKLLEMTAGRIPAMPETYLGLRHGPMSYIQDDTLVVCFLSSEPLGRAYESDLIRELNRKRLGKSKLLVGDGVDRDLLRPGDTAIELRGMAEAGDDNAPVLDVVAAQLLAFFRCLHEGLKPDSPSRDGVINRVVESFTLHHRPRLAEP